MTKIPSYQEEYVDEDKVLEFKGTAGQRFVHWGTFFNDKSVAHPAKMNLAMCEWIIDKYSKPGQIVMDMFGGTGSTGVMAVRKGRHAVICELEEPYIKDMIEPNIEEATMLTSLETEIGEARIIKCDSRELSKHVPDAVDSIITSPPYSGMEIKTKQDPEKMKEKFQKAKIARGDMDAASIGNEHGKLGRSLISGSDYVDPDNIGLLDHGEVDAIITSPPYGDTSIIRYDSAGHSKFYEDQIREKGYIEHNGVKYTEEEWRKLNHGRIDGRSMPGVDYGEHGYSGDPDNLGNLPHGNVDAVIASPPYAGTKPFHDVEWMKKTSEEQSEKAKKSKASHYATPEARIRAFEKMKQMEDPDSIDNLDAYGEVDAIIASPPYGQMELSKKFKSEEDKLEYAKKLAAIDGRSVEAALANIDRWADYEGSDGQIANMPHGEVDTVVSSPPYGAEDRGRTISHEKHDERRGHNPSGFRSTYGDGEAEKFGESENIGDPRPYGEVDTVITSPPYVPGTKSDREAYDEEKGMEQGKGSYRQKYSDDEDNIGNPRQYGEIDTVVSSPPYSEGLGHKGNEDRDIINEKSMGTWKYSDDEDNIGNLKHGEIDTVVSSPPYSEALSTKAGGGSKRILDGTDLKSEDGVPIPYSEDPDQIGNMPHGEIDTVVSSPPYGAVLSEKSGGDDRPEKMREVLEGWGYSPKQIEKVLAGDTNIRAFVTRRGYNYSDDGQNIGNLPTGKIDSVIASPPYEGSLEDRGGTQDKFKEEKGTPAPYSKNPDNIGNQTKETYLSAMLDVYRECFKVMKADGFMVLVTKNFVRNKEPVRLDLDTIKLCEHAGFTLADRWWFRLPFRSFWAIQHTRKYIKDNPEATSHPYAVYEDILVFQKVI